MNYNKALLQKQDVWMEKLKGEVSDFTSAIEALLGLPRRKSSQEWIYNCPFHHHGKGRGDKNPSFSINSQTGLWQCFAGCHGGGGDLITLWQLLKSCSSLEAYIEIRQTLGLPEERRTIKGKKRQKLTLSLAEEAKYWLRQKISVVPLKRKTKIPSISWKPYQTRLATEEEVEQWAKKGKLGGLAVVCGNVSGGLLCVDFDGQQWEKAFNDFQNRFSSLVDTLQVKTGSGKRHVWLRFPALSEQFTKEVKEWGEKAQIELRGNNHMVVVPPSIHPEGGKYEYVKPQRSIRELTEEEFHTLLEWIREERGELTLEDYASYVGLPVEWLSDDLKLREEEGAVVVPFFAEEENGTLRLLAELRLLDLNGRRKWRKGDQPQKYYGWWFIAPWRETSHLYLLDSISACQIAWYAGLPALGVTEGARLDRESWKALLEAFPRLEEVVIIQQPESSEELAESALATNPRPSELKVKVLPFDLRINWLQARGDTETFREKLTEDEKKGFDLTKYHTTEVGIGECFRDLYGFNFLWVEEKGSWFHYDGVRWKEDNARAALKLKETIRLMMQAHSLRGEEGEKEAKKLKACEKKRAIEGALWSASHDLRAQYTDFDQDPYLLTCSNGVVDLKHGILRTALPEDRLHKSTNVEYDPEAPCPRWERFLREIFLEDEELIRFIQEAVGYTLSGLSPEYLFICHGYGANGKSTFLYVLEKLMGEYAVAAPASTFQEKRGDLVPNDLARLAGARFCKAVEVKEKIILDSERIKALTGGDKITARFLHREYFEFYPIAKIWWAVNHKPIIKDTTHAMWRRIMLIPFKATFDPYQGRGQPPEELKAEMLAELPGILVWAVKGFQLWRENRFREVPKEVQAATESYRRESDVIGRFLDDCCDRDSTAKTKASELYQAYKTWAEENGEPLFSQTRFGLKLKEKGIEKVKDGIYYYLGIKLKIM